MPALKRLSHQIGRRGVVLLWLALVDVAYASSFAFPTKAALASPVFRFFGEVFAPVLSLRAGLLIWAAAWGVVGITCLVFAFREEDELAYIAAIVLKAFWTLAILGAWLFVGLERGYLSVAIWGFFAIVLAVHLNWRENSDRPA